MSYKPEVHAAIIQVAGQMTVAMMKDDKFKSIVELDHPAIKYDDLPKVIFNDLYKSVKTLIPEDENSQS